MQKIIIIFILCCKLSSCVNAVHEAPAYTIQEYKDPYLMVIDGKTLIQDGDLLVRLNTTPGSEYLKNFNRLDKKYSHAGIVLIENGDLSVYHIVNGEENPDEKLKKDSLTGFCNPRKNSAYGIFRYDLSAKELAMLKHVIHQWYKQGIRFDSTFNLKTDKRMYCSEMISKALTKATRGRIMIERTKPTALEARFFSVYMRLPYSYTSNLEIVAIDNLYTNRHCKLVKEYNYETN